MLVDRLAGAHVGMSFLGIGAIDHIERIVSVTLRYFEFLTQLIDRRH